MTRAPGDEGPGQGGGAAERLRQFMHARFGEEEPATPTEKEGERGEQGSPSGGEADEPCP